MKLTSYVPDTRIEPYTGPLPACPICRGELQAPFVDTILTCCKRSVYVQVQEGGFLCVVIHF